MIDPRVEPVPPDRRVGVAACAAAASRRSKFAIVPAPGRERHRVFLTVAGAIGRVFGKEIQERPGCNDGGRFLLLIDSPVLESSLLHWRA
jgi:hypothetical protein